MITLFDYLPSQNAYKVRLLLSHLKQPYATKLISLFEGEGAKAEYLDINPTGAVPAIQTDDGRFIAESNAILFYLASGTDYLPNDTYQIAKVVQWLSFEGDYVQSTVATLRHWKMTGKDKRYPNELIEMKCKGSLKTLSVLDRALGQRAYLSGDSYTIADISVFAYVHLADEAGISLKDYLNIKRWIGQIKKQAGFTNKVYPYSIDPHSVNELP